MPWWGWVLIVWLPSTVVVGVVTGLAITTAMRRGDEPGHRPPADDTSNG
jgi:hypothetical protein